MKILKKLLNAGLAAALVLGCAFMSGYNAFGVSGTPAKLTSIQYVLDNNTDGYANGTVTIVSPSANVGMDCEMYWADKNGNPLDAYIHLSKFKITGTTTTHRMTAHTVIPKGAETLVAYTSNNGVLSSGSVSVKLPENSAYILDESKLITEFQLVSDIHVSPKNTLSIDHFNLMLRDIKIHSSKSSGIFINGDIADHGLAEDFEKVLELYNNVGGLPKMYIGIGNHDWWYANNVNNQFEKYVSKFNSDIVTDTVYYDVWVDGFHFIFLGSETDTCEADISDAQLAWFEKLIEEDSKNYPDKPVFVMLHQGLYDGVSGGLPEQNWDGVLQEGQFRNILARHSNIILASGHSHWHLNTPRTMNGGDMTTPVAFNTASISYLWEGETEATSYGVDGSHGYYVRIYEDVTVLLGREFKQSKFIPSAIFIVDNHKVTSPKDEYSLSVGETVNMNASCSVPLEYRTSNEQVATVDAFGNITAHRTGEAYITATAASTNTKTVGRKSVKVTVSKDGMCLASLPFDFYATVSFSDMKSFMAPVSNGWVGLSEDNSENVWRFTRLSDGTYKITFQGMDSLTLKNIYTDNFFKVAVGNYSNQNDSIDYHWYVYLTPQGTISMRPANICTVGDGTGFTLDVNTLSDEKNLYFNPTTYKGNETQQFFINLVLQLENHTYPSYVFMNGKFRYLNSFGTIGNVQTDWYTQHDNKFYLDSAGYTITGFKEINGKTYLFNPANGIMAKGWFLLDGTWYHFNDSGHMNVGWLLLDTTWYYLGDDGKMRTGWQYIDNEWYYMDQSGAMNVGWHFIDTAWYYFNPANGIMFRNGEYLIDGVWYTFRSDGSWVDTNA